LHPDGLAITLQNGIGNRLTLACRLGEERTALGITTYGASLLGPGRVRPGGDGQIVLTSPQVTRPVGSVLEGAGFEVEYTDDASALQWAKLLINAAINPLTALLDVTNGELLQRPSARALMTASALETATVASVMDIQMPFANPVAAVEEVAHRTAANRSSMLQDIQRSAPTEIDAINGAIVKAGEESGVPTPVNRTLWLLIKAKQGEPGNKRKV
jgi:2-dehydropantoate 2-reductase